MLAPDNWCVKVKGKVYGPYTSHQLHKFARQGRLSGRSLIAPAGSRSWRYAAKENAFSGFFSDEAETDNHTGGTASPAAAVNIDAVSSDNGKFGRQPPAPGKTPSASDVRQAPTSDARSMSDTATATKRAPSGIARRAKPLGQRNAGAAAEDLGPANFVIIFDVVSGAATRVSSAIQSLGPAFRIANNVWSVHCTLTAHGVKNAVAPFLRPNESIFVVDATHGRSAWQNYGPEQHAKIAESYMLRK